MQSIEHFLAESGPGKTTIVFPLQANTCRIFQFDFIPASRRMQEMLDPLLDEMGEDCLTGPIQIYRYFNTGELQIEEVKMYPIVD